MLTLHLVNRVLAALLSLAVVVATALLATEVARWAFDQPPWLVPWEEWGDTLTGLRAGDTGVLLTSAVAALLGLLLLVFELAPRRPRELATAPLVDGVTTVTTRRGVRTASVTAARSVSGVRSASADVRRRRVDVRVRTRARGVAPDVADQVGTAVHETLTDLQLERTPKVRVKVEEES